MHSYELTSGYYNKGKRYVELDFLFTSDREAGLKTGISYLVGGINNQGHACSVFHNNKWIDVLPSQLKWSEEENSSPRELFALNVKKDDIDTIDVFIESTKIGCYDSTKEFLEELIEAMADDKSIFDKVYHILI